MNKHLSLIHQEGALKSYFPKSQISRKGEKEITWTYTIAPTIVSMDYRVKLHYSYDEGAKVYVLDPNPLELASGKDKLPHVYSTTEQRLCLYYPAWREWHPGKLYVHTLIPWTSEWLYHYEIWVGTGVWHGGGIDHENTAENEHEQAI
jgi:hypothetical protein